MSRSIRAQQDRAQGQQFLAPDRPLEKKASSRTLSAGRGLVLFIGSSVAGRLAKAGANVTELSGQYAELSFSGRRARGKTNPSQEVRLVTRTFATFAP